MIRFFKKVNQENKGSVKNPIVLANRGDRQNLLKIIETIIEKLKIRTHRKEHVFLAFRNIFERAFISKKELSLIFGVFSKMGNILGEITPYES